MIVCDLKYVEIKLTPADVHVLMHRFQEISSSNRREEYLKQLGPKDFEKIHFTLTQQLSRSLMYPQPI